MRHAHWGLGCGRRELGTKGDCHQYVIDTVYICAIACHACVLQAQRLQYPFLVSLLLAAWHGMMLSLTPLVCRMMHAMHDASPATYHGCLLHCTSPKWHSMPGRPQQQLELRRRAVVRHG
jgi:hypothetical protein